LQEDTVTQDFFVAPIRYDVGSGTSTSFWLDPWLNGHCPSIMVPELFVVVAPRARKCTITAALENDTGSGTFQGLYYSCDQPVPLAEATAGECASRPGGGRLDCLAQVVVRGILG
jgi:hypothetical protein